MRMIQHLQGPGQHGLGDVPEPRPRLDLDGLQPQQVVIRVPGDEQIYMKEKDEARI